jgi:UDP-N-acetylglucosamine:LPS N-acetylglucosamine transferase
MAEGGAALLCPDAEAGDRLLPLLLGLLDDPDRLRAMAGKAQAMARPEAAAVLADAVIRLAHS